MMDIDNLSEGTPRGDPGSRLGAERGRFLSRVIGTMLVIAGLHFVVWWATGGMRRVWDPIGYVGFAGLMLAALRLLDRGWQKTAGWIVCGTLYLALTTVGVLWGTIEPGVATGFIVFVLVSGFSMGAQSGAIAAVLTTVTLATMTMLRAGELLPPSVFESTPASMAAFVAFSVIQAGALIWYGLRRLEVAVGRAAVREGEARQALAELTATREESERRALQGEALSLLAAQLVKPRKSDALRQEVVEAVSRTLDVKAAALILSGEEVKSTFTAGLSPAPGPATSVKDLAELVKQGAHCVIEDAEDIHQMLDGLFDEVHFEQLVIAPVPASHRPELLIIGSARRLTESEGRFILTVAHLLGEMLERQSVEAELRQAQKMEVVGQISGSVAHDFNNLLSAIVGSAELLGLDADDKTRLMTDNIIRAGEHASMLTRQLLAFSKRRPETVDIHDLCEVVSNLSRLLDRLTGERIQLITEICDPPVEIEADRGNVEQVLFNLVANARDAITGNGMVRITLKTEAAHAVLCVSDDGNGMSAETQAHIFDAFFTTKAEGRGTGLGLATVRRILNDAGGTIEVESASGEGTRFSIRLPLAERQAIERKHLSGALPESLYAADIVLLDDNALVREATRAMLENAGHRVTEGASGEEGIEIITQQEAIDLILTDVVMPGMGGVELVDEIRGRGINIPIIFMTGYSDPDLDIDAAARASDLLHKPVRQELLLRKVNEVLQHLKEIQA